jgi:hypothetical protein
MTRYFELSKNSPSVAKRFHSHPVKVSVQPENSTLVQPSLAFSRRAWMRLALLLLSLANVLPVLCGQSDIPPLTGDLQIIGGDGGDFFRETCPAGAFLTGFALHAGDDVDAIEHLCLGPGERRDTNTPFHGGSGGKLAVLLCPASTSAVIGLDVTAEGERTTVVNNIHVYCGLAATGQQLVAYPEVVFDGPPVHFSSGASGNVPRHGHQVCPTGKIATGVIGRAGSMLDAVGLHCAASPAALPPPSNAKVIGRLPGTSASPPRAQNSLCDSAASARARNSPAAPTLEAQCKLEIAAREKADLQPGPSGAPVSICDAAQAALDRAAPEAADLAAKCRAQGGGQSLVTESAQLATQGRDIAAGDVLIADLRKMQPEGDIRRGFDIGVAVTGADQQWGPGKQKILDSLKPAEQEGFKVAASFIMDRNRNAQLAATGAAIAAHDPIVLRARTIDPDVRYWLGFDIASALYGDPALGAEGSKSTGPGSERILAALSAPAQRGFNASLKFHLSRHY